MCSAYIVTFSYRNQWEIYIVTTCGLQFGEMVVPTHTELISPPSFIGAHSGLHNKLVATSKDIVNSINHCCGPFKQCIHSQTMFVCM